MNRGTPAVQQGDTLGGPACFHEGHSDPPPFDFAVRWWRVMTGGLHSMPLNHAGGCTPHNLMQHKQTSPIATAVEQGCNDRQSKRPPFKFKLMDPFFPALCVSSSLQVVRREVYVSHRPWQSLGWEGHSAGGRIVGLVLVVEINWKWRRPFNRKHLGEREMSVVVAVAMALMVTMIRGALVEAEWIFLEGYLGTSTKKRLWLSFSC